MGFLMSQKRRGFTLVEVLFVIAIIALLSSVVVVNIAESKQRSRDVQRKSDIEQIQLALRLYKDANGEYPFNPPEDNGKLSALSVLVPEYLPSLPNDPLNDGTTPVWAYENQNTYYYWSPGDVGLCNTGKKYTLWYRLETESEGNAISCVDLDDNSYTVPQ